METFTCPHLPPQLSTAYIALFRNVNNASSLRDRIIRVSTSTSTSVGGRDVEEERDAVNFAFVDARLITSRTHIRTAIHQALLASTTPNGMRTRSVHSEILFYLNPTNNITESFKTYGLSPTSHSLLVIRIGPPTSPSVPNLTPEQRQTQVQELMRDAVIGTIVPLDDPESGLRSVTDWAPVRKLFKLNTEPAVKNARNVDEERVVVDRIVTSAVAMKSVMQ